jgi:signal transduction histidine kinase
MPNTHQTTESNQMTKSASGRSVARSRVEKVVEALATLGNQSETLSEVAHDARNMVTALGLYCDLLEEPGVLATPFLHYSQELRLIAGASRRLVEKLVALDAHQAPSQALPSDLTTAREPRWPADDGTSPSPAPALPGSPARIVQRKVFGTTDSAWRRDLLPAMPVANVAAELLANRNLLSALAGPRVILTVDTTGGTQPVRVTAEDLTRVLVNLVKNAAEAMPAGGRIHITLKERPAASGTSASVLLAVEDNGPGIPSDALPTIFTSGFTTRGNEAEGSARWSFRHRGLGLAITRSIVEAAGGRIAVRNREQGGAQFEIELPVPRSQPSISSF